MPLTYDLENFPACLAPKRKVRFHILALYPHSNGDNGLRKPRNWVFAKMVPKTSSGSGFHFTFQFSVVNLVDNATNLLNNLKVEKFKKYVNELREFLICRFLIFCGHCGRLTLPKFTSFHKGINFFTGSRFWTSVKLGVQGSPKLVSRATFSKFPLLPAATVRALHQWSRNSFILHAGKIPSRHCLKFGANPYTSASRGPTPQKVFPQFLQIVRGQDQNFDCVIQGPPRVVRDKISVTVLQLISPQKIWKFWWKSSISWVTRISTHSKKLSAYTLDPYDTAKGHPRPLKPHDFKWKKTWNPIGPMVNCKTLEQSCLHLTPPQKHLAQCNMNCDKITNIINNC